MGGGNSYALPPLPTAPAPNRENQIRGWRSHAKGKAFETLLDRTFAYYAKNGIAKVDKTPEPMKVIRPIGQGRFCACYTKQAQPDYKGTLKGGKSVMLEAKYTEQDRIKQDAVSDAQAEYLAAAEQLGAKCYVVVGFASDRVYRVPYAVWDKMKQIWGRKYVMEADIDMYQVKVSRRGTLMILEEGMQNEQGEKG